MNKTFLINNYLFIRKNSVHLNSFIILKFYCDGCICLVLISTSMCGFVFASASLISFVASNLFLCFVLMERRVEKAVSHSYVFGNGIRTLRASHLRNIWKGLYHFDPKVTATHLSESMFAPPSFIKYINCSCIPLSSEGRS